MIDLDSVSLNCKAHYLNLLIRRRYPDTMKLGVDLSVYAHEWEKAVERGNGAAALIETLLFKMLELYYKDYQSYLISDRLKLYFDPIRCEHHIDKAIHYYRRLNKNENSML